MPPSQRLIGATLAGLTVSIILRAAAGVHALMSFSVARRRKEIGMRWAPIPRPRRGLRIQLTCSIF